MRVRQLNITRNGIYWYTKRYTLSFSWRCRWHWKPETDPGRNGGGRIVWGWWMAEKLVFSHNDDWGEELAELHANVIEYLVENSHIGRRDEQDRVREAFSRKGE